MLKQFAVFETKEGEHEVKVLISASCPLGVVHDALYRVRSYVVEKINEAQKLDEPKQTEEVKAE